MGILTAYSYNELDRRISTIRNYQPGVSPDNETNVTTEFAYDSAGNLRFITNPLNHQGEIRYDAAHRKTEVIDFEGGSTTLEYDKVNNLVKVTDAEGNSTLYSVDELDRLVSVTNAENETTGYAYDLVGNKTRRVEPDNTVTLYEFDGVYRLNRVHENYRPDVDPGNDVNAVTAYSYDRRGLLTGIMNANGAETLFAHNGVGKLIQETDPLGMVWQYEYDGNRNRTARRDAKGDLTEYGFFPDDMLHSIAYADGTSVAYAYDPNNNRTGMTDKLGETSWSYDPLNRAIEQNDPFNRVLASAYDADSNRVGMTYPDGNQVAYEYSPNSWLKKMTDPAGQTIEYSRDLVGNLTHIVNPNQTETEIAYDKVYRTLKRINWQTTKGGKVNSGFEYTYNELGHITQAVKEYGWRKPSVVTETYGYDGLHRLSFFEMSPLKNNREAVQTFYQYDSVGNRLSWASNDDLQTNTPFDSFFRLYEYNPANQMSAMEYAADKPNKDYAYEYSYDENGNRINRQLIDRNGPQYGVDYSYDPENRLVLAQDYQMVGGGKKKGSHRIDRAFTTLEYDGGGRRLVQHYDPKQGGNGVDKRDEYVFDGLDPVAEYDMLNGQRTDYYRGAGGHLALMHQYKGGTQGQMYWYHYNNKGDVAGLTKHNGNSHHNYRYDPYGAVLPENGNFTDPHNHYTLTGKEFDENTGLVWFGARHYEPETGVWMGQDVYRGMILNPMSLYRYQYNYNNSVNYIDPDGRSPLEFMGGDVDRAVDLIVISFLSQGDSTESLVEYMKRYVVSQVVDDFLPIMRGDDDVCPGVNNLDVTIDKEVWVNLLLGTAAVESNFKYIIQKDADDPAHSFFQIERMTHRNMWFDKGTYLSGSPCRANFVKGYLPEALQGMEGVPVDVANSVLYNHMLNNYKYAVAMALNRYLFAIQNDSELINKLENATPDDVDVFAEVWKEVYNTKYGKGTEEVFKEKYMIYVGSN
ncbi:MAG: RHS repeat protein [Candidatus Electrothrix sp. ATG2]|nr:RHS repeat protein [Candidatus Electrothrix sp. ATG2]